MLKIAVIGGSDTVMGFSALGLETCPAGTTGEALAHLKRMTKDCDDYAIIYIEESLAQGISAEIDKFKDRPTPAIILIPGRNGSLGIGKQALNDAVEKAVGTII